MKLLKESDRKINVKLSRHCMVHDKHLMNILIILVILYLCEMTFVTVTKRYFNFVYKMQHD